MSGTTSSPSSSPPSMKSGGGRAGQGEGGRGNGEKETLTRCLWTPFTHLGGFATEKIEENLSSACLFPLCSETQS